MDLIGYDEMIENPLDIERDRKYIRITQEQLKCYNRFCDRHPEVQKWRRCDKKHPHIFELWQELCENLNMLPGPKRTMEKWKETFTHWKHQKTSRAKRMQKLLQDYEKKSSTTVASATASTASTASTAAIAEPTKGPDIKKEIEIEIVDTPPSNVSEASSCNQEFVAVRDQSTTTESEQNQSPEDVIGNLLEYMKKRDEREERMLRLQEQTAEALQLLSQGLAAINQTLTKLNNKFDDATA